MCNVQWYHYLKGMLLSVCIMTCGAMFTPGSAQALEWQPADQVNTVLSNPIRSKRNPDAQVRIDITNGGTQILQAPARLVFSNILPASVAIAGAAKQSDGTAILDLAAALGSAGLVPGAKISLTVTVTNGGNVSFGFAAAVQKGVEPPTNPTISVHIESPVSLVTLGASPVQVTGSVAPANAALTLNGIEVPHSNGTFSAQVALQEGHNTIVARAVLGTLQITDSVSVSLDLTPPYVTIESHQDGATVYSDTVTVTGLINDIVRGTVEAEQANVTVNGQAATISNRSYAAENIHLVPGANTIRVVGTDQVGNAETKQIVLNYVVPVAKRIELVSGNDQTARINEAVPQPLTVRVLNDALQPVVGAPVVFRVVQDSGVVGAGTADAGRGVVVETNADGLASTGFKLGVRVGTSNQKVRAKVVGYEDEVIFNASATGRIGNKLSVNSGNNQRGAVGQVLPEPFVVAVTDEGANVVAGARVVFSVERGDGVIANNEQATYETQTDSDGRATAEFKLGVLQGLDAQRVTATLLDAPEGQTISAGFMASAFVPADPGLTTVSGIVLDNQDKPIPGVTVRVDGTNRQSVSDAAGQFRITQSPVGPVHLVADGSTATVDGEFPSLSYNIVTVAGVDNPLASPIYMVKLNTDNAVYAGPADVALELDQFPGFKLEIAKDSVTFPDGSRQGYVSVTSVNSAAVPMAPPNGMQPQFIVTIQPTGARFDPPARLTLPNVDAHAPGAQVEMYSYDHDLEEFVAIGLGTVSEDGTVIASNSGVGVVKAGWHCGSQPGGSGCCGGGGGGGGCPVCQKSKSGNCNDSSCEPDDGQDPGKCKKCSGGASVNDDSEDPGECKSCKNGNPENDPNGAACDDGKYCTSFNGSTPGPDQCENGSCKGNKIPKKKTSEIVKEINFSKLATVLETMKKVTDAIKGSPFKWETSVKGQTKEQNVEECCETTKEIKSIKAEETNGQVEFKGEGKTPPWIIPTPIGNVNVIGKGGVAIVGKVFGTKYFSDCQDEGQCNEKWGFQASGTGFLALALSYLHPNILEFQGEGRAPVSGTFSSECGDWKGKACAGPFNIRGSVKSLSFLSYQVTYVIRDSFVCSGGGTAQQD